MALVPGARLGPYEVTAQIGAGGMGEVYKACDTRLDRTVAVKILPSDVADDPVLRARFEREARAVAALDHPHVCGIYDIGAVDGIHYLVMPYLDGQTLAARLEKGPLPLDQALKIGGEIADALDKAHRQGITHRDLKPANIMLTKTGSKLLDFGLAKLKAPVGPISMSAMTQLATTTAGTAQGTILGTVQYMAPEQVEGKEADARSDIWALGAVIYEAITGTRPFQGDTPASIIGAILKDDPPPLSRVQPLAPPLLDHIVTRCLAKDPDDRWQSARDLRQALGWTGETTPARSGRAVSPARWVAAVVALLAGGAVLGWFGASARAPVAWPRALSLEIGPPPGGEFVLSTLGGGSAISPDGKSVAFVAKVDGISRLWVRPLDSIKPQELPDTDDAQQPFWSPDGQSLAYFAHGQLRKIQASGGASTVLTRVSNPRGGSWNADGTIAFGESVGPLQRISESGGARSPLTTLAAAELNHRWPHFLPDGRTLFFFVAGDRPGVYVAEINRDGDKQRVVDASIDASYVPPLGAAPGYVLSVRGDSLVAQSFDVDSMRVDGPAVEIPGAGNALTFTGPNRSNLSVANDGTIVYAAGSNRYQLTWFGADGAVLRNVGLPDRYVGLRISPDGAEALAFVDDAVGNRDIWRVELASGVRNRVTSDNRGMFGTWSRGGQGIAFSGLTRQTVFERRTSGDTGDSALLRSDHALYPVDWSRDSKYLLYVQDSPGQQFDVWALPTAGAGKATPILQTPALEWQPEFSPNVRFIAFTSDESGREEVYIQNFPDATMRKKVSTGGGGYPRWSRNGNELFYRSLDGQLVAVPVQFKVTSVDLGDPRLVMRLIEPPGVQVYPYDIASDGRILALARVPGAAANISLTGLVDWQAALQPVTIAGGPDGLEHEAARATPARRPLGRAGGRRHRVTLRVATDMESREPRASLWRCPRYRSPSVRPLVIARCHNGDMKVVGTRDTGTSALADPAALARTAALVRGTARLAPRGVYRFSSFDEADAWMTRMLLVYARAPEPDDLVRICRALNDAGARYVLIGGSAVLAHGGSRFTKDIDLLVDDAPENVARVKQGLAILADNAAAEVADSDLRDYIVVRVIDEVIIDLMGLACGLSYTDVAADMEWHDMAGVRVPVALRGCPEQGSSSSLRRRSADGPA